jgi:glycine oxidase
MRSEVLIIGGGVIGLSIARELHKSGIKHVTLIEKGICGGEASWTAAGMLSPQVEADETGIFFDLCCASRDLYPAFAEELLDETGVDIELDRTGTLQLAFTDEDVGEIRERLRWLRKAGFSVNHLSKEEVHRAEPLVSPSVREALFFPNDWQVENRKLLVALKSYAVMNHIKILERTEVEKLVIENNRVIGAKTKNGIVTADKTVVATGAWTSLIKLGSSYMPFKVAPIRGQIVVFQPQERLFQHVIHSRRGYVVPRRDGRVLAGSTSENVGFDRSVTESAGLLLREMACELIPNIADVKVAGQWSGLRPNTSDGLPVLGRIDGIDGLFMATGHYRNGILLAPITAKLAANNLINSSDSEYIAAFGAKRFMSRGLSTGGHG